MKPKGRKCSQCNHPEYNHLQMLLLIPTIMSKETKITSPHSTMETWQAEVTGLGCVSRQFRLCYTIYLCGLLASMLHLDVDSLEVDSGWRRFSNCSSSSDPGGARSEEYCLEARAACMQWSWHDRNLGKQSQHSKLPMGDAYSLQHTAWNPYKTRILTVHHFNVLWMSLKPSGGYSMTQGSSQFTLGVHGLG